MGITGKTIRIYIRLTIKSSDRFKEPIFKDVASSTLRGMKRGYLRLLFIITGSMFRKIFQMFG